MGGLTPGDWNQSALDSVAVAEIYATSFVRKRLLDAEKQILSLLGDRVAGKEILDIGVGGGRTAPIYTLSPRGMSALTMPQRWFVVVASSSRRLTFGAVMLEI